METITIHAEPEVPGAREEPNFANVLCQLQQQQQQTQQLMTLIQQDLVTIKDNNKG